MLLLILQFGVGDRSPAKSSDSQDWVLVPVPGEGRSDPSVSEADPRSKQIHAERGGEGWSQAGLPANFSFLLLTVLPLPKSLASWKLRFLKCQVKLKMLITGGPEQ